MPVPVAIVHCRDQIYSPYSGVPAGGKYGVDRTDLTLLFIYHGEPGGYDYVSKRLETLLNEDIEKISAEDLHEHLNIDGGLILEVITDMNDPSYYGFAP